MNNNVQKKGIASYWLVAFFVVVSFVIVLFTSGIFSLLIPPVIEPTFETTAQKWEKRIVKVVCDGEQSTGFIMESEREGVDNYLYIVTSAHGVDGNNPSSAEFTINNQTYTGENLSLNSIIDVAVYKVKAEGKYYLPSTISASTAQQVMALGYPGNANLTAETGFVNNKEYVDENSNLPSLLCYDVSAYVKSGMSGCPILSIDGKLIGVGVRTKQTTQNGQTVVFSSDNYVVPASIVFAEYDRAVEHTSKSAVEYVVKMENGAIVLTGFTIDSVGVQVVYQNGQITIGGKKVEKVANETVKSVIDFVEKISYYSNRNKQGEVRVLLEDGEILVKVVNE